MPTNDFHAKTTALEVIKELNSNLDGKIVLITGVTSGRLIEDEIASTTLSVMMKVLALKQHALWLRLVVM